MSAHTSSTDGAPAQGHGRKEQPDDGRREGGPVRFGGVQAPRSHQSTAQSGKRSELESPDASFIPNATNADHAAQSDFALGSAGAP